MCRIFAGQDPATYDSVTKSVRLSGHATSIRLEAQFWEILAEIAEREGVTMPKFLNSLYEEALQTHGDISNFASLLRVSCLVYLKDPQAHAAAVALRQLHQSADRLTNDTFGKVAAAQ
jgi:predicted DNA-binding ribbon-helix-helix protein